MHIAKLGELMVDESIEEWLVSAPVAVPVAGNKELVFTLDAVADDPRPEDFAAAIEAFLAIPLAARDTAAPHVFALYRQFCDAVDADDVAVAIASPTAVWNHVHFGDVLVRRRSKDDKIYVAVHCGCDWDIEHGLQLVFRDGRTLSRVSEQDGHMTHSDAWGLPDSEDRIL